MLQTRSPQKKLENTYKISPSKYILSYNGVQTNQNAFFPIIERHSKLIRVHKITTRALHHSHISLLISLDEIALIIRDRLDHEDIQ